MEKFENGKVYYLYHQSGCGCDKIAWNVPYMVCGRTDKTIWLAITDNIMEIPGTFYKRVKVSLDGKTEYVKIDGRNLCATSTKKHPKCINGVWENE